MTTAEEMVIEGVKEGRKYGREWAEAQTRPVPYVEVCEVADHTYMENFNIIGGFIAEAMAVLREKFGEYE